MSLSKNEITLLPFTSEILLGKRFETIIEASRHELSLEDYVVLEDPSFNYPDVPGRRIGASELRNFRNRLRISDLVKNETKFDLYMGGELTKAFNLSEQQIADHRLWSTFAAYILPDVVFCRNNYGTLSREKLGYDRRNVIRRFWLIGNTFVRNKPHGKIELTADMINSIIERPVLISHPFTIEVVFRIYSSLLSQTKNRKELFRTICKEIVYLSGISMIQLYDSEDLFKTIMLRLKHNYNI